MGNKLKRRTIGRRTARYFRAIGALGDDAYRPCGGCDSRTLCLISCACDAADRQPKYSDLLPPEAKTTQAIQKLNREEGGANVLSISFEGGDKEARQAILAQLGEQIREREDIDYVLYGIEDRQK